MGKQNFWGETAQSLGRKHKSEGAELGLDLLFSYGDIRPAKAHLRKWMKLSERDYIILFDLSVFL